MGSCEHCNEPSGFIKCWEILEWLRNWRVHMKSSAHGVSLSSISPLQSPSSFKIGRYVELFTCAKAGVWLM
jgi:hypothetical protein